MHIPTTLKHKPVLVAEDYGRIDGRTAYGSDAQGLSLGLAKGTYCFYRYGCPDTRHRRIHYKSSLGNDRYVPPQSH